MSYLDTDYVHVNGDLKCPECGRYVLPQVSMESYIIESFYECGHCLEEFKITVKIIKWEKKK